MQNFVSLLFSLTLFCQSALAQSDTLLTDQNGDGLITYLGFGDSITFGVGDTILTPPSGYVTRLGSLLGINTINSGVPGEQLLAGGEGRFPGAVINTSADLVGVMEGANDAIFKVSSTAMRRAYQRLANVTRAVGKRMIIMTLPPPCCDHFGLAPFTDSYSQSVNEITAANPDVRVADIRRAWRTTCQNAEECELYNLPEGLHPNALGYTVIAQTVAASLLDIDIFAPDGAAQLESALGLEPGAVVVKPGS